jgi:hypothetical protein
MHYTGQQTIKIIATTIKITKLNMDLDGGRLLPLNFHFLLIAPSLTILASAREDCS